MKNIVFAFAVSVFLLFVSCTTTHSVITEFDAAGNIVKKTETAESVIKEVTESTKEKTVVAWESGWAAYISASTATTQDPTPTLKMFAGKTDKGLVSALPEQQDWDGIAEVVNATKYELSVSADGISSNGISSNGISSNGISSNGISSNGVSSNGVSSESSAKTSAEASDAK